MNYILIELDNEDIELPLVMFKELLRTEERSDNSRQANVFIFQKGRMVDSVQ